MKLNSKERKRWVEISKELTQISLKMKVAIYAKDYERGSELHQKANKLREEMGKLTEILQKQLIERGALNEKTKA